MRLVLSPRKANQRTVYPTGRWLKVLMSTTDYPAKYKFVFSTNSIALCDLYILGASILVA